MDGGARILTQALQIFKAFFALFVSLKQTYKHVLCPRRISVIIDSEGIDTDGVSHTVPGVLSILVHLFLGAIDF